MYYKIFANHSQNKLIAIHLFVSKWLFASLNFVLFFLSIAVHSNEKINSSQVTERIAHDRYIIGKPADDLAFFVLKEPIALGSGPIQLCLPEKDFSENILMKHGKEGMTVGATNKPSYLPLDICQSKLNLSFSLTNKMFCMEKQEPEGMSKRSEEKKIECDLASGSPVATMEGNTAFLTGLFMSQSDCTQGLVFTKISRYLPWIRNLLRKKETVQRWHIQQEACFFGGN